MKGKRFTVAIAREWLEAIGLPQYINAPDLLPDNFDTAHRKWRKKLITIAKIHDVEISDGIAAKLINCYLKAALVCSGNHSHPKVAKIHPPIDRLLLSSLAKAYSKPEFSKMVWSTFNADEYESVIKQIKCLCNKEPLWAFASANPRLRLHYLPPYSPNINAIEPAWKIMHEHTTNNQYHPNFKAFTEKIREFFDKTFPEKAQGWTDRLTDNFRILGSPLLAA